jgi:hypothetical protein
MCLYGYEFPRFRWDKDPKVNKLLDEALDEVKYLSLLIDGFILNDLR